MNHIKLGLIIFSTFFAINAFGQTSFIGITEGSIISGGIGLGMSEKPLPLPSGDWIVINRTHVVRPLADELNLPPIYSFMMKRRSGSDLLFAVGVEFTQRYSRVDWGNEMCKTLSSDAIVDNFDTEITDLMYICGVAISIFNFNELLENSISSSDFWIQNNLGSLSKNLAEIDKNVLQVTIYGNRFLGKSIRYNFFLKREAELSDAAYIKIVKSWMGTLRNSFHDFLDGKESTIDNIATYIPERVQTPIHIGSEKPPFGLEAVALRQESETFVPTFTDAQTKPVIVEQPTSVVAPPQNATLMAQRRALVIGNDNYKSINKLQNAREDAKSMAEGLQKVGYQVILKLDLNQKDMKAALRNFKNQVEGGDEVMVFYAGHGIQIGATNYLLPVDISGESEDQIKDDAIQLQKVLDDMSDRKAKFTLAMIDACRDNPFKTAGRQIGGRGLSPTTAATGQMVVFSAGTGQQALDKVGANDKNKNGLFTRIFLKEMQKPGISIDRVVRNVRTEVVSIAKTIGHDQVPAIYDQVIGEFFFIK